MLSAETIKDYTEEYLKKHGWYTDERFTSVLALIVQRNIDNVFELERFIDIYAALDGVEE